MLNRTVIDRVVGAALEEDAPWGDLTSESLIPETAVADADLTAREEGVFAGGEVFEAAFRLTDPEAVVRMLVADGERFTEGQVLATVHGPARSVLQAERVGLNFVQRMSGIATLTARYVAEVAHTGARIADTRKTTPGLRALEKYAVRAGGGTNKRMGLHDVAMIKDNHKVAAGGIGAAYRRVREAFPEVPVQVEVDTLAEAVEAVEAGAKFLLLDNMTPAQLREVVAAVGDRAELEATGGLTLPVAAEYGATGVDFLSVGALTHSSPILDIALDLREE